MSDDTRLQNLTESISELENIFAERQRTKEHAMANLEDDPISNLNERLSSIESVRQQQAQDEQRNAFAAQVSAQVNSFKADCEDYDQAFEHVVNGRMADLKALGMNEQEALKVLDLESAFIAERAMRSGQNPGAALYQLAKNRGFQGQGPRARTKADADAGHDDTADVARTESYSNRTAGDDEFSAALRERGWK